MIHTIIKYLLISITLFFCSCHKPKTDIITPAKQLIERQIGERAQSIHFEYIEPSDGKDIHHKEPSCQFPFPNAPSPSKE